MIREVLADQIPEKIRELESYLPFSANAIHSLKNFSHRAKLLSDEDHGLITVIFKSNYNKHIWYSPIIWIFGNLGHIDEIFQILFKEYFGGFTALAFGENFTPFPYAGLKFYEEDLMLLHKLKITPKRIPSRLDEGYALESLKLSSDFNGEIGQLEIEREKNFLKERETYGFVDNGMLISRGSIMSQASGYSGVGGFITNPNFRNMGYGTDMVSYISQKVLERGNLPFLTVRSDNRTALSLYSKIGFSKIGKVIFIDYKTGSVP